MKIKEKLKSGIIGATMLATVASPSFAKNKSSEMDTLNKLAQKYNIEFAQDEDSFYYGKLPKKQIAENTLGGTDLNPSFYVPTDYEKILLARAIAAEAYEFNIEHMIAVGEVIMRRVMSSEWGRGINSIHAVLSEEGQYPTTWAKITDQIKHKNHVNPKTLLAAKIALSGTTNFSKGVYFQHSNGKINVFKIDGETFSDNKRTSKYKLKDFTKLAQKDDMLATLKDFGKSDCEEVLKQNKNKKRTIKKSILATSPKSNEAEKNLDSK